MVLYTRSRSEAAKAGLAAFDGVENLEQMLSDYRKDCQLACLLGDTVRKPKVVSPESLHVLERALLIPHGSNGAFDGTVGPFVALWRRARRTKSAPDPAGALATAISVLPVPAAHRLIDSVEGSSAFLVREGEGKGSGTRRRTSPRRVVTRRSKAPRIRTPALL